MCPPDPPPITNIFMLYYYLSTSITRKLANETNCEGDEDHAGAAVREERERDTGHWDESGHCHDVDDDLGESPRKNSDDEDTVVIVTRPFGDLKHLDEHDAKNKQNQEKADEAEGLAHDGEDGVIDRLGEIAGGLDGITDADAGETACTDGKHGVVDMVGRVGAFGAGQGIEPGCNPLHAMRRSDDRADGNG